MSTNLDNVGGGKDCEEARKLEDEAARKAAEDTNRVKSKGIKRRKCLRK